MKWCVAHLFLVFFLTFSFGSFSQGFEGEEFNGKLEISSGEVLLGDIFYEAATGKVIITNEKGSEYFSARNAAYFEFYDFEKNSIRKFYSLLYNNLPTFFELLKETSKLALLSRENVSSSRAIASLTKSKDDRINSYPEFQENHFVSETLFLADDKGNIYPYVVINSNRISTTSNYVTPYLLATLTKGKYSEIRKFAKQNKYSFKNKQHLLELLEFYDDLD